MSATHLELIATHLEFIATHLEFIARHLELTARYMKLPHITFGNPHSTFDSKHNAKAHKAIAQEANLCIELVAEWLNVDGKSSFGNPKRLKSRPLIE